MRSTRFEKMVGWRVKLENNFVRLFLNLKQQGGNIENMGNWGEIIGSGILGCEGWFPGCLCDKRDCMFVS